LGWTHRQKVEATLKVELIMRALDDTLSELGLEDSQVRPVPGRWLRTARRRVVVTDPS
jgi:hypothetical protein